MCDFTCVNIVNGWWRKTMTNYIGINEFSDDREQSFLGDGVTLLVKDNVIRLLNPENWLVITEVQWEIFGKIKQLFPLFEKHESTTRLQLTHSLGAYFIDCITWEMTEMKFPS